MRGGRRRCGTSQSGSARTVTCRKLLKDYAGERLRGGARIHHLDAVHELFRGNATRATTPRPLSGSASPRRVQRRRESAKITRERASLLITRAMFLKREAER